MIGVVIPFAPGREDNLAAVLTCLERQSVGCPPIVVVMDGVEPGTALISGVDYVHVAYTLKHEPGMEQPRNIGTRILTSLRPDVTHVWFLDSDVIVDDNCLEELQDALEMEREDRILVAPYDWLPEGWRPLSDELGKLGPGYHDFRNDPRWPMFNQSPPDRLYTADLSAGLACFSGNLVWPVDEFVRVGGFWSEIHHGRCEDGELGLRAVAMDVPISFAAEARGWHLAHPINHGLAIQRNARDVPMLNERHPWVERGAVFMVDRDGKAFDVRCPCGQVVETINWWKHAEECGHTMSLPV